MEQRNLRKPNVEKIGKPGRKGAGETNRLWKLKRNCGKGKKPLRNRRGKYPEASSTVKPRGGGIM